MALICCQQTCFSLILVTQTVNLRAGIVPLRVTKTLIDRAKQQFALRSRSLTLQVFKPYHGLFGNAAFSCQ
jgi:hypothetical protein